MRILITGVLIFFASPAFAGGWDRTDRMLMGSFAALEIMDAMQTRDILADPDRNETNPALKHCGENGVVPYFAGMTILSYIIADHMQPQNRKVFLSFLVGFQAHVVGHNYRIGVKFKF